MAEPTMRDIEDSIAAANAVYSPAGVQFFLASLEVLESPEWWNRNVRDNPRTFRQILPHLKRVFPWMPDDAYRHQEETKTNYIWLVTATSVYARPYEITVHVMAGGSRASGQFPRSGRGIYASYGTFGDIRKEPGRVRGAGLFAHELGHYLGLRHTFAHAGTDPRSGRGWRLADRWDLVYRPGSSVSEPHTFFASRDEAAEVDDRALRLIDAQRSCARVSPEAPGLWSCNLRGRAGYVERPTSGSFALQGFSPRLAEPTVDGYYYAINIMGYGFKRQPGFISRSQIEMIHAYLGHDLATQPSSLRIMGRLPDGVHEMRGYRPLLGLGLPGHADDG